MAESITLSSAEIGQIEKKLREKRATMGQDEVQLLEALVRKANAERPRDRAENGWQFSWTYHF